MLNKQSEASSRWNKQFTFLLRVKEARSSVASVRARKKKKEKERITLEELEEKVRSEIL